MGKKKNMSKSNGDAVVQNTKTTDVLNIPSNCNGTHCKGDRVPGDSVVINHLESVPPNKSQMNGIDSNSETSHTDPLSSFSHCDAASTDNTTNGESLSSNGPEDTSKNVENSFSPADPVTSEATHGVTYVVYESELQMGDIMRLIQKDLSEPYSIYTYRYFIHNWPHLCFMARVAGECVGAIVCKLDFHKMTVKRGYIAMLAVDSQHRKRQIGSTLVKKAIHAMIAEDADEVVLETEITNKPALRLYENLGFVRDKRLFRYYLNGVDALRLKLWLR